MYRSEHKYELGDPLNRSADTHLSRLSQRSRVTLKLIIHIGVTSQSYETSHF